ncbi:lipid A deacylase LpxR family protein [Massilia sp. PAMC28688]|nr:lipid A deacylase LpxR family protein [Massilia sp. PAMC28688]
MFQRTLLALVIALQGATAAPAQAPPRQESGSFFTWENDSRYRTDRFYTSGVQLSTRYLTDQRGDLGRSLTHAACRWLDCDATTAMTSQRNVGQLIFTPRDITRVEAQPHDRPWAGYLYYEKVYAFLSGDQKRLTTVAAQAGVTGPLSLAEHAQKAFHRVLERPRPMGWHHQIGGSLGVNVSAEQRSARDALSFDLPARVRFNTATYWRLGAGTVNTYAGAGIAIVVGKNLPPVSPAPPGIGDGAAALRIPARTATCLFRWLQCTAFASAEARLVAYSVFLDGRVFRDDPNVDKRAFVYEVVVGNRFDLPSTRTASHGPWFVQMKGAHKSAEFHSPLGVPSHRVYSLTFGTDF